MFVALDYGGKLSQPDSEKLDRLVGRLRAGDWEYAVFKRFSDPPARLESYVRKRVEAVKK